MAALLPIGLSRFQDSSEVYCAAQARQQILNNLQQSDVHSLLNGASFYTETFYFDGAGGLLGTSVPGNATPVYQVVVTVSTKPTSSATGATTITVPTSNASVNTLLNAVIVTTQFSRYFGASVPVSATVLTNTDYLFYNAN